ncbi:MAG: hypothetical protein IH964_11310 [Candidatus Dadabacteria bacterium]|nr:hypothetical protein [Candidatus Dadabacteria bacterium]
MTISRYKDNRDEEFEHENVISLKHFPYKLRKVAKYLLQMDKKVTIKQACEELNVKYGSVRSQISREKIKGNDFYKLIEEAADNYLKINLIAVDSATLEGALNGSARDREIYYKRTDKLHDRPQIAINTNLSLTYAIQVNEGVNTDNREKGENSLIPYIPVKPK